MKIIVATALTIALTSCGSNVTPTTVTQTQTVVPTSVIPHGGMSSSPTSSSPSTSSTSTTTTTTPTPPVYYKNCAEARAAGAAPIYRGQPGYRPGLDRDGDGIACERGGK
jgi:hypothetical protein